jgi:hypothetical protein
MGVVGLVAAAAVISSVTGARRHGGAPPAAAAATAATGPAATTVAGAVPVGDVRRLPKPRAGDLHGAVVAWSDPQCIPTVLSLDRLVIAKAASTLSPACYVWTSPDDGTLALAQPGDEQVYRTRPIISRGRGTGLTFIPQFDPQLVTVADGGSVAVCDGSRVLLSRAAHGHVVRSFEASDAGVDERCITGALGTRIVRLGDDRRRLVDVASGRILRHLAQSVPRPVTAIATSSDGDVAVADGSGDGPGVTVFGPTGAVIHARHSLGRTGVANKLLLAKGGGGVAFETQEGWTITNLATGAALSKPGDALVWDVAFAPDGRTVALATPAGLLFASLSDLALRWRIGLPSRAVGWFDGRLFPGSPAAPL